jgi:hypothetical protein
MTTLLKLGQIYASSSILQINWCTRISLPEYGLQENKTLHVNAQCQKSVKFSDFRLRNKIDSKKRRLWRCYIFGKNFVVKIQLIKTVARLVKHRDARTHTKVK